MNSVTIRQFFEAAKYIHPKQAILLRGRSGIGKSQIVYQLSKILGLPIIERRAAQLTESDLIGLPDKTPRGATCFYPPDWFLDVEEAPHAIFFDEPNRSTLEVGQALFQFVEKGELNGRRIHPESRIFCAVNFTPEYQVAPMDFALLDRFAIFDLNPDRKDWIDWAESPIGNVHPHIVTFIKQCNEEYFEVMPEVQAKMDMTAITPSRRSWERFNRDVTSGPEPLIDRPDSAPFYHLAASYLGTESARALILFLTDPSMHVSPEEILQDYTKVALKVQKMTPEQSIAVVDKLVVFLKDHVLDEGEVESVLAFMADLPAEVATSLWSKLSVDNTVKMYAAGGTKLFELLEKNRAI